MKIRVELLLSPHQVAAVSDMADALGVSRTEVCNYEVRKKPEARLVGAVVKQLIYAVLTEQSGFRKVPRKTTPRRKKYAVRPAPDRTAGR